MNPAPRNSLHSPQKQEEDSGDCAKIYYIVSDWKILPSEALETVAPTTVGISSTSFLLVDCMVWTKYNILSHFGQNPQAQASVANRW